MPNERQGACIKFSVVIPVYNRVSPLKRAIESVVKQTDSRLEILVIDDGSNEETASRIKQLVSTFSDLVDIKLIVHERNFNGAKARNTGIKSARGEYICFLDSDDAWMPDKLSSVNAILEGGRKDVIYHQYVNIVAGQESSPVPLHPIKPLQLVSDYIFVTNPKVGIQTSTITVRRELALQSLFNESLSGHQDWDFTMRIGKLARTFDFIGRPLCRRYLSAGDHVSGKLDLAYSRAFLALYNEHFSFRSRTFYYSRVLLKKALVEGNVRQLLFDFSFYMALMFDLPTVWSECSTYSKKQRVLKKRLKKLDVSIKQRGARKLIIYGANSYADAIVKRCKSTDVISVIDANAPNKQDICGIQVKTPEEYLGKPLSRNTWVVLATDKHTCSMTKTILQFNKGLADRIICM